jgi:hypothetical protein
MAALMVASLAMEGNSFFLIHVLQLPKTHWFNPFRLTIMSLLAMVARGDPLLRV